mmetsp:Transcript_52003/g.126922  ORF Transcript_52003/g.126922 Transcript_52003/m.126922 type:complete len:207 (-) Transcript_52003:10-630(-)
MEIDTQRLSVGLDLSRFTGYHIRDALTMPAPSSRVRAYKGAWGMAVKGKVLAAAKSKLHPILLDACLNPSWKVRQNLYQVIAITAMKHVCYHESSAHTGSGLESSTVVRVIRSLHPYIVGLPKRREFRECGVAIYLKRDDVRWLGTHAYLRVLRSKGPKYAHVRQDLEGELRELEEGVRLSDEKLLGWLQSIAHGAWTAEMRSIRF